MPRYLIRLPWEDFAAKFPGLTDTEVGEQVGRTRRTVVRWKTDGLPLQEADSVAVLAGFHPSEVWGERFYEAWEAYQGQQCQALWRKAERKAPVEWRRVEDRWHSWWWENDARRVLDQTWSGYPSETIDA